MAEIAISGAVVIPVVLRSFGVPAQISEMTVYYNDNDPFAAAWLRELIKDGLLPEGTVDERSITDVRPEDCGATSHFFAGIGGWAYALRLAGWEGPVWTASLPCPSFSAAGKRRGVEDPRHLWPAFYPLVAECCPPVIFGEQVEGAVQFGWLDGIFADLEAIGYACGAACLPAAGVGAPHIRSRLFWVAYTDARRFHARRTRPTEAGGDQSSIHFGRYGEAGGMAYTVGTELRGEPSAGAIALDGQDEAVAGGVAHAELRRRGQRDTGQRSVSKPDQAGAAGGMGHADGTRPQGHGEPGERAGQCTAWAAGGIGGMGHADGERRQQIAGSASSHEGADGREPDSDHLIAGSSPWIHSRPIYCRDGRWRRIPTQSAVQPLAPGLPNRVGLLRGAGNAICPQIAAEFVKAFLEVLN